ncbi:hypothetical protein NDU88_003674 [Pleurodeles waltl]|uniref:Uncharacterized protein n=1 Tax=Pleurodeles waltl TaxID=8319 RepID=A0AAV7PIV3_PLEWA|nr:hypothetical protein NDU88_003674 [Pleurodeles waltl]
METSGEYVEEDQISYLLIDNNFCHIMDATLYKVVTQLMAPLEKKIDLMASQCSFPLPDEDSAGASGLSSRGCGQPQDPSRKCTGEDALEAFARLKKARFEQPPNSEPLEDILADSPHSSDADLEPEGPTLMAKDPAMTDLPGDDMLDPDDLVHARSSYGGIPFAMPCTWRIWTFLVQVLEAHFTDL